MASFLRSQKARKKCGAGRWKRGHKSYLKCALAATKGGRGRRKRRGGRRAHRRSRRSRRRSRR